MTPINPASIIVQVIDYIPKTVSTSDATYIWVAEAEAPDTPYTTAKWRRYRYTRGTMKVDWAQNTDGQETSEFIFTGVEADLTNSTYGQ